MGPLTQVQGDVLDTEQAEKMPVDHQPRRNRRRIWWFVWAAIVVALAIGLVMTGLRMQALVREITTDTTEGRQELLAGAKLLKDGGLSSTRQALDSATNDFTSAQAHFDRAHAAASQGRFIRMLMIVPATADQVRAVQRLTSMGSHAARAGTLGVQALQSIQAATQERDAHQGPGERILRILGDLDPKLDAIEIELRTISSDRSAIGSAPLVPPLARAVTEFDSRFKVHEVEATISQFRSEEPAIRTLIGASGPRSYLVLLQDPAELRGTGGFIGSVGFLDFDQGRMAPFHPQNVYDIDTPHGRSVLGPPGSPSHVDVPPPLQAVFHLQSWEVRDSNWSPDFPTAAQTARSLLDRETGRRVDGVVAIDPFLVARLLSVTGPISVPETGDVVDEKNFFATTLARVNLQQSGKTFLSYAAKAIFDRLLAVQKNENPSLLQAVAWGCSTRSLQVWVDDAQVEGLIDGHGCGGEAQSVAADGVMVVDSNVGGNKDDFWLQRSFSLALDLQADGRMKHTLRVHYYGLTAHPPLTGKWGYTGWLRLYLPSDITVLSVDGAELAQTRELGKRLLQGWLYVKDGSTKDVTVVYELGTRVSNGHLELLWQKQAGRQADPISVQISLPRGWTLRSVHVGSDPVVGKTVSTDLAIDRRFVVDFAPS